MLILILAPRHIERSPVIIKELKNIGCEVVLRSNHIDNDDSDLWLLDSTGELQSLYNDADIVFIFNSKPLIRSLPSSIISCIVPIILISIFNSLKPK